MKLWSRRMRFLDWPKAELMVGEHVLLEERANWSRGGLARGGTLVLTEGRVVFQPNTMEASVGLHPKTWARTDIKKVNVASRGWNPLSGALRRRLRIAFIDDAEALFVVADPEALAHTRDAHT